MVILEPQTEFSKQVKSVATKRGREDTPMLLLIAKN